MYAQEVLPKVKLLSTIILNFHPFHTYMTKLKFDLTVPGSSEILKEFLS